MTTPQLKRESMMGRGAPTTITISRADVASSSLFSAPATASRRASWKKRSSFVYPDTPSSGNSARIAFPLAAA